MTSEPLRSPPQSDVPTSRRSKRDQILAVGLSPAQAESLPSRLFGALADSTQSIELDGLNNDRLSSAMVVLSPVVGPRFDAIDLAARLEEEGYCGRYIAFAPYLPDHAIVSREVAAVAPGLSFDIVETGRGPHPAPAFVNPR